MTYKTCRDHETRQDSTDSKMYWDWPDKPNPADWRLMEAIFWTRILGEHALFIKLGLPADTPRLMAEAQSLMERFQDLNRRLKQASRLTPELFKELVRAVLAIIAFKRFILRNLIQCNLQEGSLYPLLIDHITREAIHFLELLKKPSPKQPLDALLEAEVFWIRIMKEHIEFIIHLLDPSERELLNQAENFRETFSRLLETARDLESMAESNPKSFNTVIRFTKIVEARTRELRDFKAAARELAVLCKLLSIIPSPLLLDHIRREADKFLDEIDMLLPMVMKCDRAK